MRHTITGENSTFISKKLAAEKVAEGMVLAVEDKGSSVRDARINLKVQTEVRKTIEARETIERIRKVCYGSLVKRNVVV